MHGCCHRHVSGLRGAGAILAGETDSPGFRLSAGRNRLTAGGTIITANTPAQFAEQIDRSVELYARLARFAKLEPQ